MAYLCPRPHRNLCWIGRVVGGAAQDTFRALVLVWGKEEQMIRRGFVILNVVKNPALGRRGMSVGCLWPLRAANVVCDEGNFSFPEESFFTMRRLRDPSLRSG